MKKAMIAVAALAFSSASMAGPDEVPWTYADIGYLIQSAGSNALADEGSDGYKIRGSFGLGLFHIGGEWYQVDSGGTTGDIDSYDIYVGVHPGITDRIDLVIDLGYTESENSATPRVKTDGVFLRVGPRALIGDHFELSSYLTSQWGDLDDVTNSQDFRGVVLTVGGQWYFTDHFSLGADARLEDSGDNVNLFARWSF